MKWDEKFIHKFGTLVADLQVRTKHAMIYHPLFMARRLAFAIIVVVISDLSWAQVQLCLFMFSLMIIFIGIMRPFRLPSYNYIELTNESLVLMLAYFLIVYSPFVPDGETRYQLGWVNIGFIGLLIIFNLFVIIMQQTFSMKRKFKLYLLKRAQMKNI